MAISYIDDLERYSLFEKHNGERRDNESGLDVTGTEGFSHLGK